MLLPASAVPSSSGARRLELNENVEISNARVSDRNVDYATFLYERLQRNGFLLRDCQRMVNQDRNVFGSCMVAMGDADAMVTGLTRNFSVALDNVRQAIDNRAGHRPIGVSMALVRLTGPANVLVMPAAHSASISTKMLQQLGGVTVVGPLLTGLDRPVQIAAMSATASEILNLAAIAAYDINR